MPSRRSPFDHLLETGHRPGLPTTSYAESSEEDRSNQRHDVEIEAFVTLPDGTEQETVITGISQSGITLDRIMGVKKGQRLSLSIPGMRPRDVDIIWKTGNRAGGSFADILPRVMLEGLLLRFALYDF